MLTDTLKVTLEISWFIFSKKLWFTRWSGAEFREIEDGSHCSQDYFADIGTQHCLVWNGDKNFRLVFSSSHSHWSCRQRKIKNAVCQKNAPNHFVNKPMKYNSIRLTRHMSSLQWTNLYFPIQIYCSICSTLYPGVLATSSCARGTVVKKPDRGGQLVPKSQPEKSHWVGLVLHWGWETVPQVWKHRCDLRYNVHTTWCDMEVQADR